MDWLTVRTARWARHSRSRSYPQGPAFFAALVSNEIENGAEFGQSLFARGHEWIAAGDGGNLGDPGTILLAIENDLVIVELHRVAKSTRQSKEMSETNGEN